MPKRESFRFETPGLGNLGTRSELIACVFESVRVGSLVQKNDSLTHPAPGPAFFGRLHGFQGPVYSHNDEQLKPGLSSTLNNITNNYTIDNSASAACATRAYAGIKLASNSSYQQS